MWICDYVFHMNLTMLRRLRTTLAKGWLPTRMVWSARSVHTDTLRLHCSSTGKYAQSGTQVAKDCQDIVSILRTPVRYHSLPASCQVSRNCRTLSESRLSAAAVRSFEDPIDTHNGVLQP